MSKLYELIEKPISGEWGEEDTKGNGIPVLRTTNFTNEGNIKYENIVTRLIKNDKAESKFLKFGDIIIEKSGGSPTQPVGRVVFFEGKPNTYLFNNFTSVLRIKDKNSIFSKYLFYTLFAKYGFGETRKFQNKTTGILNLKLDRFIKEVDIPLPPLEEQHKIASILDTVSKTLKLRKQQLNELDLLVKSKFEEMFGNPVVNPKGFLCYTVDDVIEFQGGSQPDKKYFEYEKTEDNIRLIQIRDYKSNRYLTYIPKIMAKRFCTVDDIMIGRYGPPIFQILQGIEGSFNVALMKAIPRIGNKEFIRYFLKQDCLLKYLEGLSKRTAGQDGIQMDKLKLYPFPYPPIELQNKFASFVQTVDKLKSEVQKSIDQLQTLFDSLMQQYFE